jgi:uncharacterized protein DUF3489
VVRRDAAMNQRRISMSKPAKKHASAARKPADTAKKPARRDNSAKTAQVAANSKQSRVIAMLRSPTGATIVALMKVTGWQQHSVRGFLAGVVRKRLKLKLGSAKMDGARIYRIAGETAGKAGARRPTRRAG